MSWKLEDLLKHCHSGPKVKPHGTSRWLPARPLRLFSLRNDLREAWEVFRRRADAFTWPEDDAKEATDD